jgi:hypothetical protein
VLDDAKPGKGTSDGDQLVVARPSASKLCNTPASRARPGGLGPVAGGWWLVAELIAVNTQPEATVLWQTSRVVPGMRARVSALVDDLVADAARALGTRSGLGARAVVVTALAVVHEIALPAPTPARRRAAVDAVLAVVRNQPP